MPARITVEPGTKFSRLAYIRDVSPVVSSGQDCRAAEFSCDCGATHIAKLYDVRSGRTKSCGCLQAEARTENRLKHGQFAGARTCVRRRPKDREYDAWVNMNQRCGNERHPRYADYGGRGITVCERWRGGDGFTNFIADMGKKPTAEHSIDRVENDGNYEPGNCQWATDTDQSNNRRSVRMMEFYGKALTLSQWAAISGVTPAAIKRRLSRGWSSRRAVWTPPSAAGSKNQ